MHLRWVGGRPLACKALIAALYEVSERSVRRHCRPVLHEPQTGRPRGVGGAAMYDALAAADDLADVVPRRGQLPAALLTAR